ncbi:MAG: acyl--CoA ligase [Oscillospiraceae bacterium]|nr:acyl--CoA ligase [Oscillospiraceae bacterium]
MIEDKKLTGYPSIDKPWLRYYSEEAINAPLPECTMYEYIWRNNKSHLEQVALNYYGTKITFRKMFENIKTTAEAFSAAGVKAGDIIIIVSVTTPELIYSVYALNYIGAIPNMVDPRTSTDGIRDYIKEVSAKMILTIDLAYPKILESAKDTSVRQIIMLSVFDSMPAPLKAILKVKEIKNIVKTDAPVHTKKWRTFLKKRETTQAVPVTYQPNQCAIIVHTGGTTGLPKGVMLSNDNANAGAHEAIYSPIYMKRGDSFLNIIPPFVAYGMILGIHTPLSGGWTSYIIPKFDPNSFDRLLIKYKPNGLIGIPSYYEKMMSSKLIQRKNLGYIKCLLSGGDKTQAGFETRINQFLKDHNANIHLTKGYSMTEASAMATVSYENTIKIGSNGVPLVNTLISAFEEGTENELKYGQLGEICISSPTIMMGYYHNQKETDGIVRVHHDGRKWIHSGDLGYVDHDGFVYIEGRLKRVIIPYHGFKVFPSFIESVVLSHFGIDSCCVVGKKDMDHGHGQIPIAFCVLKHEITIPEPQITKELFAICQQKLPDYSQPAAFRYVDALPLTPIGKVDYRALERMAEMQNSL